MNKKEKLCGQLVEQNQGIAETTYHRLIWGWLRLFLAMLQISLSVAGITALLIIGFRPLTWALVAGASFATLSSLSFTVVDLTSKELGIRSRTSSKNRSALSQPTPAE
jgi:hypothetical protein